MSSSSPDEEELLRRRNGMAKRLRKSPVDKSPMPESCGTNIDTFRYDLPTVPAEAKMSLKRKSRLDVLKDRIPKPRGAVPTVALPIWYEFDMNSKVPMIPSPKNVIYYSRGKLCQPLHKQNLHYTVWDEWNQERVINEPYSALHDPHCRGYFMQPKVQRFLYRQGFINENKEVLCTFGEFSKYRDYLRTLFNDEVWEAVRTKDARRLAEWKQLKDIWKSLDDKEGRQAARNVRRLNSKKMAEEREKIKKQKAKERKEHIEMQMQLYRDDKERNHALRVMEGMEKGRAAAERLYKVKYERLERQRAILRKATIKEIEHSERKRMDDAYLAKSTFQHKLEWLEAKYKVSTSRIKKMALLDLSLRDDQVSKALKRQRHVEFNRALLPIIIERSKAAEKRLWEIVRKFAMRWLEKVRRRLNAPKDVQHESVWIGGSKNVLEDTVKVLKEISGYETLDDFVLNIIKLKKQIQQQIELEEAEEAARLAAEEEEEDEQT